MVNVQKKKILFVIGNLAQSGSERFTYEVLRAIDRKRFDVELLTTRRTNRSDFYYEKIVSLGIPIHCRLPLWLNRMQRHARGFYLVFRPLLEFLHRVHAGLSLGNLLDRFDVINAIQLENYLLLQPLLSDNRKVIIYVMAYRFQYRFNPFEDCRRDRTYRLSIYDTAMRAEYAGTLPQPVEEITFPLAIDLSATPDLSDHARIESPYRIGVFIRLAADRPISGILRAFAALRQDIDAQLWLYGRGSPARLQPELDRLGISGDVVFKGHTPSIERTLREDGLSMVWMTSYGAALGYASIEVGAHGFPILFWNQHGVMPCAEILDKTNGAVEAYFNPSELAAATLTRLSNPDDLRRRGRVIRNYILAMHDIANHIGSLQEKIAAIAMQVEKADSTWRVTNTE